jgi:hypothetical protein
MTAYPSLFPPAFPAAVWQPAGPLPLLWTGAVIALAAALGGRALQSTVRQPGVPAAARTCHYVALASTLISALVLAVLVLIREAHVAAELLRGGPLPIAPWLDLAPTGLAVVGLLLLACALLPPDPGRPVVALALGVLGAFCVSLLVPTFATRATGGFVRNPVWLVLLCAMSGVLCVALTVEGALVRHRRALALRTEPARLLDPPPASPGFRAGCGAIALFIAVLSLVGLAVPVELHPGGYRLSALVLSVAAFATGAGAFVMLGRQWNLVLADLAMALVTLAVCALLNTLVPSQPRTLDERYPMIFNAILFALAIMTWLWSWLAGVWRQQLDEGRAWTTTGLLVEPAAEFSFQTTAAGLVIAILMAGWPRLPGIIAADDSPGRLLMGIGAHFLLLLAVLACRRRTGRTRFTRAAVAVAVSLLLFLGARALG